MEKKISNPFIEFDDSNQPNDFDIGSYIRIAKAFPERYTLFLDTHTRPNSDNWLKIFANHYKPKEYSRRHCILFKFIKSGF